MQEGSGRQAREAKKALLTIRGKSREAGELCMIEAGFLDEAVLRGH